MQPQDRLPGHDVTNQPDPWHGDLWAEDRALQEAVAAFGGSADVLASQGRVLGSPEMRAAGRAANRHPPEAVLFDRGGRRLDQVSFHPAYHAFLELGLGAGYAAGPWTGGRHVTHAGLVYLHSQIEPGSCCPMTMSYAAVPVLQAAGDRAAPWVAGLTSGAYDPAIAPAGQKAGLTVGMAMTEKQGGSDVRSNSTRAEPQGDDYRLTGHKWFCSAPMSDGFLTLAQAPGGLTCFLVPRWLPEGRNAIHILRLKDKLGNRSNASAEIEYHGALAHRIGPEGEGVRTIIEMVHHTRLDTALAPAGLMRAALAEAVHWARGRSAFQRRLIDQPLMRQLLAELAIEAEAALWLGLRIARAFDGGTEADRAFARIGVALAKFINNKRCPNVVYEAMEALGGIGYVEEAPLAMLYREAPLNSIWEGSGNVICLDILRSLQKAPMAAEALLAELEAAQGAHAAYDAALDRGREALRQPDAAMARDLAGRLADLLTASVLIRHAPAPVAEGFLACRLSGQPRPVLGASGGLDVGAILDRWQV